MEWQRERLSCSADLQLRHSVKNIRILRGYQQRLEGTRLRPYRSEKGYLVQTTEEREYAESACDIMAAERDGEIVKMITHASGLPRKKVGRCMQKR